MKNFDILLVGFDHTHPNNVILTVGRKKKGEKCRACQCASRKRSA